MRVVRVVRVVWVMLVHHVVRHDVAMVHGCNRATIGYSMEAGERAVAGRRLVRGKRTVVDGHFDPLNKKQNDANDGNTAPDGTHFR